jgi:hypothetical protein
MIGLPIGNIVTRGKDVRGAKPYFIGKLSAKLSNKFYLLKALALILKKMTPKIKIEAKVEVKQEITMESTAGSEHTQQSQHTVSSLKYSEIKYTSKKRKSPEAGNRGIPAETSQQPLCEKTRLKKPKIIHNSSRNETKYTPADAAETPAASLVNESIEKVLNGNSDQHAQGQTPLSGPERVEINHELADNQIAEAFKACVGDDMDDQSDWEARAKTRWRRASISAKQATIQQ